MSFSRKLRRGVAASTGLLAAGVASAAFAGPALATTGASITASGSSLQNTIQGNLTSAYNGLGGGVSITGGHVTYGATSSGDGLAEFGDAAATINGTSYPANQLNPGANNTQGNANSNSTKLDGFIGTDDAPTTGDITAGETAANGSGSGVKQITVPVTQAPVAQIFSIPAGITFGSNAELKITNTLLFDVWTNEVPAAGTYLKNTWGALLEDAGFTVTTSAPTTSTQFEDTTTSDTASKSTIVQYARSDGSGTTFTERSYLNEVGEDFLSPAVDTYGDSNVNDSAAINATNGWPITVNETGTSGSGGEVNTVADASGGAVGYVNLADAMNDPAAQDAGVDISFRNTLAKTPSGEGSSQHYIAYALIQDNGVSTSPKYADPSKTMTSPSANVYTGSNPNTTGIYSALSTSHVVGDWFPPSSEDGSWAAPDGDVASGNDPDVFDHAQQGSMATPLYPVDAATYDVVWSAYTTSGTALDQDLTNEGQNAQEVSNTVTDYIKNFVFSTAPGDGQALIAENGYQVLPGTILTDAQDLADDMAPLS